MQVVFDNLFSSIALLIIVFWGMGYLIRCWRFPTSKDEYDL